MDTSENGTKIAISSAQIRAARALLGWSQDRLVEVSGIPKRTVVRLELDEGTPQARTISSIRAALEEAGVIFVAENGEGAGVRLRKQRARGHVWDPATTTQLFTIRDGRVYRARDGKEVGALADNSVYGLDGRLVCEIAGEGSSDPTAAPGAIPEALKALLD